LNENVLAFTRVGYTNLERPAADLEGLTLGGGLEVNVAGPVYGKIEYRYTDFDAGVGRHGGLVGVGFRF
jgi:outer membrane immunogenic protein